MPYSETAARGELGRRLQAMAELQHVDSTQLVEALRQGRVGASDVLVQRYSAVVRRALRRHGARSEDVEDLAQEVLVRALRRVHELRVGDRLASWLVGIASYVAHESSRARRRKRHLVLHAPWDLPQVAARETPPTGRALAAVAALLAALPEEQRVAFTLRVVEDVKMSDLPDALGVSLSTAKRRVARAAVSLLRNASACPPLQEWLPVTRRAG